MRRILILFSIFLIFSLTQCSLLSNIDTTTSDTTTSEITSDWAIVPTTTSPNTGVTTTTTEKEIQTSTMTIKKEGKPIAVGIWHRPNVLGNETNLEGIKKTLDTFKKCGINIVYLETIYHGMAIYKSNFLPYYTGFSNFSYGEYKDYLDAFTTEALKRGIEVHAWVEDFYIGVEKGSLADKHPEWLLINKNGNTKQTEGNGYYFLDPANHEVTNFLLNLYRELLTKNSNIRGINLDYIRYPVSSKSDDTGFTEYAMNDFLESIGYTLNSNKTLEENFLKAISNNYSLWTKYRADKVTQFVKDVREMTNEFGSIILSTAIFPNMSESYETKKQDFTTWMKNHYIDVLTPMAYYDNTSTLEYYLKEMLKESNGVYCYTGVSCIYHDLSNNLVLSQIDKCLELSNGFVIFGSQKLLNNENYINLLENKFKNTKYYLPHLG